MPAPEVEADRPPSGPIAGDGCWDGLRPGFEAMFDGAAHG
jgi:hypothetical protein